MNTLITPADVIRMAFTAQEGYRENVITEADICAAESLYIIPMIGEALYKKLHAGSYADLLEGYVAPALAAWTRYIVEPLLAARCCEGHLPTMSAVECEILREVLRCRRRIAEALSRRLTHHLDGGSYTEYKSDANPKNRCNINGGIVQVY